MQGASSSELLRSRAGTGLGLFISRGIARALGGDMQLVSTPGCGSTFAFLFRATPLPAGALKVGPEVDPGLRGRTLIAAFDEEAAPTPGADLLRAKLKAVRREVEEGRGALLAAVILFMPGAIPAPDLPAFVGRMLGELAGARGAGGGAPPPLVLLRVPVDPSNIYLSVVLDPRCCRAGVVSLRLPVSEAVLHSTLADAARRRAPPAPAPRPSGSPEPAPRAPPVPAEPEARPEPAPATSTEAEGGPQQLPPKPRILFAEDTPTNAKIVLVQLRRLGYGDVHHAANGAEALRAAREAAAGPRPFRILLSDIMSL
eukprot:tig00020660_g12519.t1